MTAAALPQQQHSTTWYYPMHNTHGASFGGCSMTPRQHIDVVLDSIIALLLSVARQQGFTTQQHTQQLQHSSGTDLQSASAAAATLSAYIKQEQQHNQQHQQQEDKLLLQQQQHVVVQPFLQHPKSKQASGAGDPPQHHSPGLHLPNAMQQALHGYVAALVQLLETAVLPGPDNTPRFDKLMAAARLLLQVSGGVVLSMQLLCASVRPMALYHDGAAAMYAGFMRDALAPAAGWPVVQQLLLMLAEDAYGRQHDLCCQCQVLLQAGFFSLLGLDRLNPLSQIQGYDTVAPHQASPSELLQDDLQPQPAAAARQGTPLPLGARIGIPRPAGQPVPPALRQADRIQELCEQEPGMVEAAFAFVEQIADVIKQAAKSGKAWQGTLLPELLQALLLSGFEHLLEQLVAQLQSFDCKWWQQQAPTVLLVGQWLGQEMLSMLPSYQLLIETTCSSLAQYLEDFRLPTEAEQQQLQAVHVDLGCSCDVCRQVAAFLQDGTCTSTDVEMNASQRQHLHERLKSARLLETVLYRGKAFRSSYLRDKPKKLFPRPMHLTKHIKEIQKRQDAQSDWQQAVRVLSKLQELLQGLHQGQPAASTIHTLAGAEEHVPAAESMQGVAAAGEAAAAASAQEGVYDGGSAPPMARLSDAAAPGTLLVKREAGADINNKMGAGYEQQYKQQRLG